MLGLQNPIDGLVGQSGLHLGGRMPVNDEIFSGSIAERCGHMLEQRPAPPMAAVLGKSEFIRLPCPAASMITETA